MPIVLCLSSAADNIAACLDEPAEVFGLAQLVVLRTRGHVNGSTKHAWGRDSQMDGVEIVRMEM